MSAKKPSASQETQDEKFAAWDEGAKDEEDVMEPYQETWTATEESLALAESPTTWFAEFYDGLSLPEGIARAKLAAQAPLFARLLRTVYAKGIRGAKVSHGDLCDILDALMAAGADGDEL